MSSMQPLQLFEPLPLRERLFVRARMLTAPLRQLADRAPPAGRIADVGCGHGLVCALLALGRPDREVIGVDPDERKIAYARASVGRLPNVELEVGSIESLRGPLDAICVADVLYLLPFERWPPFLDSARRLLKPGGALLWKEAEGDGSWKHYKCLAQELLMVGLFRKTRSSGGLGLQSRGAMQAMLAEAGFHSIETIELSRGYTTPHVLFHARSGA
jgi:2-polyprenyl-6-hydroxyphenyl methylase/3-demethylubiquinone-9 3-methyltransferase